MPTLSYYSNVHNTAWNLIVNRGYQVWQNSETEFVSAEKDGWDFMAEDPVQLLGIISIFETLKPSEYNEYWWRIREPWLNDEIPTNPQPFDSVLSKNR